jgi:glyoxylase-like metal-dependent hydrolase (beta-lactamase superfamily II)
VQYVAERRPVEERRTFVGVPIQTTHPRRHTEPERRFTRSNGETEMISLRTLVVLLFLSSVACATAVRQTERGRTRVSTVRIRHANVHVLETEGRRVVVDAGYEGMADELVDKLKALGIRSAQFLVLSHGHADHVGGTARLREAFGARVVAGLGDRSMLTRGRNGELCPTNRRARKRWERGRNERFTPVHADAWVDERLDLFGDGSVLVIGAPSHTPGSVVVVADDVAFVGDLFRGSVVGRSAERHFYMCDLEDNRRRVRELLRGFPRVETFYVSHFGPVSRAAVEASFAVNE